MLPLLAWIQIAGAVQLAIWPANVPLASRLQYRKNLVGASQIVRQIFYVHAAYIVLVVLGFAALSILFPEELVSGRPLGRFLSALNGGGLLFSRDTITEPANILTQNLALVALIWSTARR